MDVCILLTSRMGVLRGGVGFCVSQEAKPRLHREDRSLAESGGMGTCSCTAGLRRSWHGEDSECEGTERLVMWGRHDEK